VGEWRGYIAREKFRVKYPDPVKKIPEIPERLMKKVRRPPMVAVVNESCTGCQNCIPFCPVDCIEVCPPDTRPETPIQPVRIRYNECIGCQICVHVCDQIWDAIDMWPTDEVENRFGIKIT
jgi:Pyruvate/2-oxoacid:ferredoxin oxidoreductase delta subunit